MWGGGLYIEVCVYVCVSVYVCVCGLDNQYFYNSDVHNRLRSKSENMQTTILSYIFVYITKPRINTISNN